MTTTEKRRPRGGPELELRSMVTLVGALTRPVEAHPGEWRFVVGGTETVALRGRLIAVPFYLRCAVSNTDLELGQALAEAQPSDILTVHGELWNEVGEARESRVYVRTARLGVSGSAPGELVQDSEDTWRLTWGENHVSMFAALAADTKMQTLEDSGREVVNTRLRTHRDSGLFDASGYGAVARELSGRLKGELLTVKGRLHSDRRFTLEGDRKAFTKVEAYGVEFGEPV